MLNYPHTQQWSSKTPGLNALILLTNIVYHSRFCGISLYVAVPALHVTAAYLIGFSGEILKQIHYVNLFYAPQRESSI